MWSHVWRCDGGFSLARCHHESLSLSFSDLTHTPRASRIKWNILPWLSPVLSPWLHKPRKGDNQGRKWNIQRTALRITRYLPGEGTPEFTIYIARA